MASLDRLFRWERYVPDLGGNRELPQPFYLEIASGLTKQQLGDVFDAVTLAQRSAESENQTLAEYLTATIPGVAAALDGVVRLGKEPLTVQGSPVSSLTEYLLLAVHTPGQVSFLEVLQALGEFNSAEGARRLFSARHSGGLATTGDQSVVKDGSPTVGP